MPTDTNVDNLVINVLTEEQYEMIDNPSSTELYLVPDVDEILWCTWSNNTMSGLTPSQICSANRNKKIVKCREGAEGTYFVYDLMYADEDSGMYFICFSCINGTTVYSINYNEDHWETGRTNLQRLLIGSGNGQNIKTINNQNILGAGNIAIKDATFSLGTIQTIDSPQDPAVTINGVNTCSILTFEDGCSLSMSFDFTYDSHGLNRILLINESSNSITLTLQNPVNSYDQQTTVTCFAPNNSIQVTNGWCICLDILSFDNSITGDTVIVTESEPLTIIQ